MGLFNQLASVIEWKEFREDMIFYKFPGDEIKKGSRLIIRPGQDVIFFANGKIEGIFKEEGTFDIESDIIPFLSTLKGFKFGFKTDMRAEVLFVNTKEFVVKWGTKNAINIPTPALPGGMPIRANGTYQFKVKDYVALIDKVAGMKDRYLVEDVQIRITAILDQLLMKWISKEGKDMFNLQANSFDISSGIKDDLDMHVYADGLSIMGFQIMSFTYPEEIQNMITKSASQSMIGDMNRYQQTAMVDAMSSGKNSGGSTASDMAGMMMGMNMASQMMQNMNGNGDKGSGSNSSGSNAIPNFCPNCGQKTEGGKFCQNCGQKLVG